MQRLRNFLGLIRYEHTVFALPFALVAAVCAQRWVNLRAGFTANLPPLAQSTKWDELLHGAIPQQIGAAGVFPSLYDLAFILLAMVSGRTLAMLANRIIDAAIDARNPRTESRHIPRGIVSLRQATVWAVISGVVFLLSALALNLWCFLLAPLAAVWLIFYPYAKRFTPFAHYILGGAQAIAPLGVFLAVTASVSWEILPLALAVGIWIGSFDIYYAIQDVDFDRSEKLHSLPADYGIQPAMAIALIGHIATGALLLWSGYLFRMGTAMAIITLAFTAALIVEHLIVRARRELVGVAFFTLNGIISVAYSLAAVFSAQQL